jgi:hypothetical protein
VSSSTDLPVDSFREAAPFLRRPFTAAAVKFKVQSTWPKNQPTGGLVVAYIDARLAVERLNLVCPHLWVDEYHPVNGGLLCRLTIDGLTRHDIGEGVGKALFSDALKRAAVKFGVGVSLYAIPQSFIDVESGTAKVKNTSKGPTLVMTPLGERGVRDGYKNWLEVTGTKAFGEPLDHGDVEGAQGDAEADDAQPPEAVESAEPMLTAQQVAKVLDAFKKASVDPEEFLKAAGVGDAEHISVSQARVLRSLLDDHQKAAA